MLQLSVNRRQSGSFENKFRTTCSFTVKMATLSTRSTVGGIKTVTFPFRLSGIRLFRSPFSSRFMRASDQVTRWVCLTNVAGEPELARSLVILESMVVHFHCLLNFAGTLRCCRSSDFSVFCDRCSTVSDFRYRRSINLRSLIDSNRIYN